MSKSARSDPATESKDQPAAAKEKQNSTSSSLPLPSVEQIMSVARDCQIKIDDKETRDTAGLKAMEENRAKKKQFASAEEFYGHFKQTRDVPFVDPAAGKVSEEDGQTKIENKPNKQDDKKKDKSKSAADEADSSSNALQPEKMYLTDEIDSGSQGDSQNLKGVKKTDFLPPEAVSPEEMYPTKSPSAAQEDSPTSPEANYNSKLKKALEDEPVVKSKPKGDVAAHLSEKKESSSPAEVQKPTNTKSAPSKNDYAKSQAEKRAAFLEQARARIRKEMLAQAHETMALSLEGTSDNLRLDTILAKEDCWDDVVESLMDVMNRKRHAIDRELFDPTLLSKEDYRAVIREEFEAHERRRKKKKKIRVFKPEVCVFL